MRAVRLCYGEACAAGGVGGAPVRGCCGRIWMSGSVGCCWGRRRPSWAGAGSRRSRRRPGCIRTRSRGGCAELEGEPQPAARVRAPGRWPQEADRDRPASWRRGLRALVDPETRGDPMSPLVWTTKSTRNLAGALTAAGHPVSDRTVARMLRAHGVQPAGQRQGHRGPPARGPGRPVPATSTGQVARVHRGGAAGGLGGHQEEGTGRGVQERRPRVPARRASPSGSTCTTSRTRSWARRSRTASTTSPRTPAGSVGRHRPRHLRLRRGDPAPLVAHRRQHRYPTPTGC